MSARRRVSSVLLAGALLLAVVAAVVPGVPTPTAVATDAPAFTGSVTATRTFVDQDGTRTEVDSRDVRLEVSQTQDLRGRQEIHVAWSGAVPTGGVVGDPNSSDARNQEYPFVLLQCRGVDTSGAVPTGQDRLTPETCWTQTSPERYLAAASHTPSWRFDQYAEPADRAAVTGAPAEKPDACAKISEPLSARWLPFRAADGTTYYGGPDPASGCMKMAPESNNAEGGGLPGNTTYGITGTDGKGETDFAVWTEAENASLGCSATVSCALVAVPIVGVSCDSFGHTLPAGTALTTKAGVPLSPTQLETGDATCRRTGSYLPGESRSSQTPDQAVRGNLWWSASNWRNRITVPLDFAVTGAVCDVTGDEAPLEVLGSVVLTELAASWRPRFCTDESLFDFSHIGQADGLARMLVEQGEVDAGLSTAPGSYTRPVVQAPIAVGGFAIAFTIDDEARQRRESLQLNARLIAKLLTASYPAAAVVRDNHESIGDNPLNITLDPEFQALNPGLPESSTLEAGAALQVLSASSDLMWALTSWLNADPEARAWLNGYADPWGMVVNEAYRDIALPLDNWPLLDDFVAPDWYRAANACYDKSPTPYLNLVANPPSGLSQVLLNMQFASSVSQTVCRFDGYDQTTLPLRAQGRQSVGYRFVLGLVSVSAARRYNLRTATLQTVSSVPPGRTFDDADGRQFVGPDAAGLQEATTLLEADDEAGTWVLDYDRFGDDAAARAYPGTMPVYAVVPTVELGDGVASKMNKLLCYAAGAGQRVGTGNGDLPAGYLPVTPANGLGTQHDYVLTAAAAVRAQDGAVPALDTLAPTRREACGKVRSEPSESADPSSSPSATPPGTPSPSAGAPSGTAAPAAVPSASVPTAAAPSGATAPSGSAAPAVSAATVPTAGETSRFGSIGAPGLLLLALLSGLLGVGLRWPRQISAGAEQAWTRGRTLAAGWLAGRTGGRRKR
jgi:hypothetical protein